MRLRVPIAEMQNEVAARRVRTVLFRIGTRSTPKSFAPFLAQPHSISGVDSMTGLVAQNAHQPIRVPALHFLQHLALEPREPRMRKIKRNRKTGNAVRREPFVGKPRVRTKFQSA